MAQVNWLKRKSKTIAVVLFCGIGIGVVHRFVIDTEPNDSVAITEKVLPASPFSKLALTEQLDDIIAATRPVLSADIESLNTNGEFERSKSKLLDRALEAVTDSNSSGLAHSLGELGELALLQGDLGMAEVYLSEALELYEELGEELSLAGIHIQMGRLHLHARQRARKASDAYDQLLLSHWRISQGRFSESEAPLRAAVESSLELNRYGAAATALETLYRGYSKENNIVAAHDAGIEAINVYAASGNLFAARDLLKNLTDNGLSMLDSERVSEQIKRQYKDYEKSVLAIGAARDYAQLYNQLSARGDALQAWRFRRQAEKSLANASKRAQYRRQPDVLVELYRSNSSMESALVSLQKASALYNRHGVDEGVERSRQLRDQIY